MATTSRFTRLATTTPTLPSGSRTVIGSRTLTAMPTRTAVVSVTQHIREATRSLKVQAVGLQSTALAMRTKVAAASHGGTRSPQVVANRARSQASTRVVVKGQTVR